MPLKYQWKVSPSLVPSWYPRVHPLALSFPWLATIAVNLASSSHASKGRKERLSAKCCRAYLPDLLMRTLLNGPMFLISFSSPHLTVFLLGDQNITTSPHHQTQCNTATNHCVDLQVPGFRWIRSISFDKTGRHFVELVPRSLAVQTKINKDWRLKNALHLLTEVNSVNGGRR